MDKLFSKKEKKFYTLVCGLSFVFLVWSGYRNTTCGYDCGLFTVTSGPVVVVVSILSFWCFVISTGIFIFKYIDRRFGRSKR